MKLKILKFRNYSKANETEQVPQNITYLIFW